MTREEAIDHLSARAYARELVGDYKTAEAIGILIEAVDNMRENVKGEWIQDPFIGMKAPCFCSNCGHGESMKAYHFYKYCPMCGAKMEVEDDKG